MLRHNIIDIGHTYLFLLSLNLLIKFLSDKIYKNLIYYNSSFHSAPLRVLAKNLRGPVYEIRECRTSEKERPSFIFLGKTGIQIQL